MRERERERERKVQIMIKRGEMTKSNPDFSYVPNLTMKISAKEGTIKKGRRPRSPRANQSTRSHTGGPEKP